MAIEAIVKQRIVEALAAHGNACHTNYGKIVEGECSQANNKGAQRACTYKDFMKCKPRTF